MVLGEAGGSLPLIVESSCDRIFLTCGCVDARMGLWGKTTVDIIRYMTVLCCVSCFLFFCLFLFFSVFSSYY